MSVSFVASTQLTLTTGTSVSVTTPAGIADDDTLLAFVFARSDITPPAGWTAVGTTTALPPEFLDQRVAIYTKDTVVSGNSSTSYTWTQVGFERMGVVYGVFRGVNTLESFQHNSSTTVDTYSITPPTVTAVESGELFVSGASSYYGTAGSPTPTVQTSFTKFSGETLANYRLATGYRSVTAGQSNSGSVNLAPGFPAIGAANGMIGFSLRLVPTAVETRTGIAAAAGPLGTPSAIGIHPRGGIAEASSPLRLPSSLAFHDFSGQVDGLPSLYVMDLIDDMGVKVRAPISSWQATLQTSQQSYLQAVVPACAAYLDAINAAAEFSISRRVAIPDGTQFEYEMARAPLTTSSIAQGTSNYTATLSGYMSAFASITDPDAVFDRQLLDVRTVFSTNNSLRVRCSVDWLLRPGQRALVNEIPMIVGYINYYVGRGDAYMDVGELVA